MYRDKQTPLFHIMDIGIIKFVKGIICPKSHSSMAYYQAESAFKKTQAPYSLGRENQSPLIGFIPKAWGQPGNL